MADDYDNDNGNERDELAERRSGSGRRDFPRRESDYRMDALERAVEGNTMAVERINTQLGERFTTLIFDLDKRYMPREELAVVYIPRREHEQRQDLHTTWRLQLPLILFAGGSLITNVLLLLHQHA